MAVRKYHNSALHWLALTLLAAILWSQPLHSEEPQFQLVLTPPESELVLPFLSPLAESEEISTQEIRLEFYQPLFFQSQSQQLSLSPVDGAIGLSNTLGWEVNDSLDFGLTTRHSVLEHNHFQPLGDIHCENGVLESGAYYGTNCRFVSDATASHRITDHLLSLGPAWQVNEQLSVKINYFKQHSEMGSSGIIGSGLAQPSPLDYSLLTPEAVSPLLPQTPFSLAPGQLLEARTEGVNLDLQLGFTTDQQGDVQLGLSLARVSDAEIDWFGLGNGLSGKWSPVSPFNTAKLDLGWSRGSFSAGIQSFYRDQVDFINRQSLQPLTTFDVHFTWRTPWNANLSIGASNALDSGAESNGQEDQTQSLDDPFEMIYGRVPYVRYQQDL